MLLENSIQIVSPNFSFDTDKKDKVVSNSNGNGGKTWTREKKMRKMQHKLV